MESALITGIVFFYAIRLLLFLKNRSFTKLLSLNSLAHRLVFLTIDVCGAALLFSQLLGVIEIPLPFGCSLLRWCGMGIFVAGVGVSSWSRIVLGPNWDTAGAGGIKEGHQLVTTGPYRFCRHPIYAGTFLLLAGFELALGSLFILLLIPLCVVIHFESLREERACRSHFGRQFEAYCKDTPGRWSPWF